MACGVAFIASSARFINITWRTTVRPSTSVVVGLSVSIVEQSVKPGKPLLCTCPENTRILAKLMQLQIQVQNVSLFSFLGLDELILQNMQKALTGEWQCLQCSFTSLRRDLVKGHVEAKHIDSGGFGCPFCGKVCPTRKALSMHNLRRHKTS